MNMKEQRAAALVKAQALGAQAEAKGYRITDAEFEVFQAAVDEVKALDEKIERATASDELIKSIGRLPEDSGQPTVPGWKSNFATGAVKAMQAHGGQFGMKALIGSTIDVPSVIAGPVELATIPTLLLELIPRIQLGSGDGVSGANTFTYSRQTVGTNNAAAVADGALKPTSVYSWDEIEDRVRVYAHVSEEFPERFLEDYGTLLNIVQSDMGAGILMKLESDVVNGTGTGEGFRGILSTVGIKTQAAVGTDLIATLSAAYFALLTQGDTPNAWVMNPLDFQKLTLMRESGSTGALLFGSGRSTLDQIIGTAPIIPSPKIAAGTALVGDFTKTAMVIRSGTALKAYQDAAMVEKNVVKFRAEGRFGFQVLRPSSFVKVTLPA